MTTPRPPATPRDFLAITDFSGDEVRALLDRARRLKRREDPAMLVGKSLAMIFRKSSTRTRVSFEVGMTQLGGHALFLSERDSQIGRGEEIRDTAGVLSRMVDGIVIRTYHHDEVVELAENAQVPVVNALTDLLHPCQVLADLQTVAESFGDAYEDRVVAWVGDGNNMANSWLNAALRLGFELRLACPKGYDPDLTVFEAASAGGRVTLTRDPREAADGADVVTTDVWASMGQEEEAQARKAAFEDFIVDEALMAAAQPEAIFLHCLPAHRGEEVAAAVIDGPQSRIFDEAENRLHVQKAILLELMT